MYIKFPWQFWTTNPSFWLVIILLRKFDASSKKEMKMIKTQIFWWKTLTKCQKKIRWKHKVVFSFSTRSTDPWCNMLQSLKRLVSFCHTNTLGIANLSINRSIHQRSFVKKCVLNNFAIFKGKHQCWSLF